MAHTNYGVDAVHRSVATIHATLETTRHAGETQRLVEMSALLTFLARTQSVFSLSPCGAVKMG